MSPLYVSDLDGTLLASSARLSDYSRAALERLIAGGAAFTVASARSVVSMQQLLGGLALELPVIEFNGAFVSDLATGRHEIVNAIDAGLAESVYALMSRAGQQPFVSTFTGGEDRLYFGEPQNDGMRWYVDDRHASADRRLRPLTDAGSALREQVVCLTCIGSRESLAALAEEVEEHGGGEVELHLFENAYSPGWHWLTVHDRRASKDQAVRRLMELRGMADRPLVAFGDEVNDLKLFEIATEAVAVANAAPGALERATHVIGSNDEDSVVHYIDAHYGRAAHERP